LSILFSPEAFALLRPGPATIFPCVARENRFTSPSRLHTSTPLLAVSLVGSNDNLNLVWE
jgi:hypothetical protein